LTVVTALSVALALGVLGLSFFYYRLRESNRRVERAERELKMLNADLENRVGERTAELEAQASVLEMIARRAPLGETLDRLLLGVEAIAPGMVCSILLLDRNGKSLRHGAAPSLPEDYNQAVDGVLIGPNNGACSAAAFFQKPVTVEDVLAAPNGDPFRDIAQRHGLRSCWSTPIFDSAGRLLGTFAMYHKHPGPPAPAHLRRIEAATHTAAICISRLQAESALQQSAERLDLALTAARMGVWEWELATGEMVWSPECGKLLGREGGKQHCQTFQELVCLEDRGQLAASLERAVADRGVFRGEFRIERPDGALRWIEYVGHGDYDQSGNAVRVIGTVQDVTERRQAADELRQSEEALRRAQSAAQVGGWSYDMAEDEFTGSEESRRILERLGPWRADEMEALIHPDDRGRALAAWKAARQGTPYDIEHRLLAGQSLKWLHVRAWPEFDESGGVVRIVGVTQDVTNRKRIEIALRALVALTASGAGEEFFQKLAQELAEVFQMDHAVVAAMEPGTPGLIRPLGVWSRESNPPRFERHLATPECARLLEQRLCFVTSGMAARFPHDPLLQELKVESYVGLPILDSKRTPVGLLLAMHGQPRDSAPELESILQLFAESAGAEMERCGYLAALRAAEARFRSAIEHAFDGLALTDATGVCTYVTPAVTRILGYTPEELVGKTSQRFFSSREPSAVRAVDERHVQHKDGTWRWIQTAKSNRLDDPNLRSVVWNFRDITDRKNAERTKAQLEAQLRQAHKMEAIGTLAGGIAHDFNNILASIIGCAELIRRSAVSYPEVLENVEDLLAASRRARELIRQILTFSRRQEHRRSAISLAPVIEESLRLLRATLPATIELRVKLEAPIPPVSADPTLIQQIVLNLATNAAQALGSQSGLLAIELSAFSVSPEFAAAHPGLRPGLHTRLTCHDNGPGIEPDILDRVFEPFFTTKEPGQGTGLGLSVVHGIVRAHDGVITVQSRPGSGTCFDVYLPAAAPEQPDASEPAVNGVLTPGQERILFVDDEPVLLKASEKLLRQAGYHVTACADPQAAAELFRRSPQDFDLVVTDYSMPKQNGVDLARELFKVRPGIPIIICTGFGAGLTREKGRQLGFAEVLLKPVDFDEFTRALRSALSAHPSPAERQ
jgi:PAS domain S-box-containing protein